MSLDFSVEDALDLAYLRGPAWNADDSRLGYLRFEKGATALAIRDAPTATETDLSLAPFDASDDEEDEASRVGEDVSEFAWRPDHPAEVAFVEDGDVYRHDDETGETLVVASGGDHESLAWHPDGDGLAYLRDGTLWLHDLKRGAVQSLEATDSVADLFSGTPVRWSPGGHYLATMITTEHDVLGIGVFDAATLDAVWSFAPSPADERVAGSFAWVDDDHFVYAADATDSTERVYRSVRLNSDGEGREDGESEEGKESDTGGGEPIEVPILSETDDRALPYDQPVGTDDGRFAVLSARTGWHHIYVVDAERRREVVGDRNDAGSDDSGSESEVPRPGFVGEGVTQVTSGEFEARGDAPDVPAWTDDGDRLAYVTNEHDPGERRLHVAEVSGTDIGDTSVFEFEGNVVGPTWAGDGERLACLRAGRTTPADVHVTNAETGTMARVSAAHPAHETLDDFPDPEPVSFPGTGDLTVRGYLYAPPDAGPDDADLNDSGEYPAVVWCHGGPMRQMRRGFHHMRSYAFFHAFNHVLVSRGYVVLELNYRGGIGYGRDFEHGLHRAIGRDDVRDCADAAAFLRDHDLVGDRVGLWGLSYGGFLANAVATKTDAFDCAVNFAGIWDWRHWVEYVADFYWGAGRRFVTRFGGMPGENEVAEACYETAAPATTAADLDTPLFALHGTDDPNVPFEQMDMLVNCCVTEGNDFEMAYYPGEDHMFKQAATWRDALGRVLPFLDEHLR